MFDEECVVSSLVQRDIDEFKHEICKLIADFYKCKDPRKSISSKTILDLMADLHFTLDCFMNDLKGISK